MKPAEDEVDFWVPAAVVPPALDDAGVVTVDFEMRE
jgi:hypothetical protein